jgi:CheY-like chemotaxis protein
MQVFNTALVVDGSVVARQLVNTFLRLHAKQIDCVASVGEAREQVFADASALVVLDMTLEGSVAWLEECAGRDPRPALLGVTTRPTTDEETRVTLLGAIGYLQKPFTYRQLASALARVSPFFEIAPARVRAAPLARAAMVDPANGEEQISCEVRDLSSEGAFLATAAPVPIGTTLELRLYLTDRSIALRATVKRIQEPRWGVTPGWGVAFDHIADSRRILKNFVAEQADFDRGY